MYTRLASWYADLTQLKNFKKELNCKYKSNEVHVQPCLKLHKKMRMPLPVAAFHCMAFPLLLTVIHCLSRSQLSQKVVVEFNKPDGKKSVLVLKFGQQ
jgi:hypothetical protein